jgi:hypothetical protein
MISLVPGRRLSLGYAPAGFSVNIVTAGLAPQSCAPKSVSQNREALHQVNEGLRGKSRKERIRKSLRRK